jgi:hypothetical protein
MTAATAKKPKRPRRPVYFRVARVVDLETGEQVGALVPLTKWDARNMRDRKLHVGAELRGELKQRRNVKFHRLAHAMGALMVYQHEGFDGSAHDAIKRLQRECGVCCETQTLDLGPLGKVPVSVPRSLAFDEMDESEFAELMQAIYRHVAKAYWPTMTPEAIEEMALMYDERGEAA